LALPAHQEISDPEPENIDLTETLSLNDVCENKSDIINNKYNTEQLSQDIFNDKKDNKTGFCYYVGILIFIPYLSKLANNGLQPIMQWVISVLLGAFNIEQTKVLNFSSLRLLFGNITKACSLQRKELNELIKTLPIELLKKFNTEIIGCLSKLDYYYDPHSKHYTGLRKILKGWCSKLHMADKILNMDFLHTFDGYPAYMEIADNFDDMRIRFFRQIKTFRKTAQIPENKILTYIIDRGIFSEDVFDKVLMDNTMHLITWEKDYRHNRWDENKHIQKGIITRKRNNSKDEISINYQYQDMIWNKNEHIRQIIVRVQSRNGKTKIEVSILTDDIKRGASEIIFLMFNRWIQENDFKYLIQHFGINQITTYRFDTYQNIKDIIDDKNCISGKYQAISKELENIRAKLKTVLYKIHRTDKITIKQQNKQFLKQEQKRQEYKIEKEQLKSLLFEKEQEKLNPPVDKNKNKEIEIVQEKLNAIETKIQLLNKKETEHLNKCAQKQKGKRQKLQIEAEILTNELIEKEKERENTKKEVSKADQLIENNTEMLDTNIKEYMDTIKIIARNIFYLTFDKFRKDYNDFRDDLLIFRCVTRGNGVIQNHLNYKQICIQPEMELTPKILKSIQKVLDDINQTNPIMQDSSNQKIHLKIEQNIESLFAFNQCLK
jgi:hypothetical protein